MISIARLPVQERAGLVMCFIDKLNGVVTALTRVTPVTSRLELWRDALNTRVIPCDAGVAAGCVDIGG